MGSPQGIESDEVVQHVESGAQVHLPGSKARIETAAMMSFGKENIEVSQANMIYKG